MTRPISEPEFARFRRFIFDAAGISLASTKQALVTGRLSKRLVHHRLDSFGDYFELLSSGSDPDEVQTAIDLLTTNETYFFRENQHFELLRAQARAQAQSGRPLRVWSAACSSGEEPYTIAMVLADCLGDAPFEVLGTDISVRMLEHAVRGLYPVERTRHVPAAYLKRFCLKGTGDYAGRVLVNPAVRSRVRFAQVNLNVPLPDLGAFDIVFLRNVMIYFNDETKRKVVSRIVGTLKPGGHLLIGHSESLNNLSQAVECLSPSVYRRIA